MALLYCAERPDLCFEIRRLDVKVIPFATLSLML